MNTQPENELSLLALANVEALAGEGSGYSCTATYTCGSSGSVSCTGKVCKRGSNC